MLIIEMTSRRNGRPYMLKTAQVNVRQNTRTIRIEKGSAGAFVQKQITDATTEKEM